MRTRKTQSLIAVALSLCLMLPAAIGITPLQAHADELSELQARKAELSEQVSALRTKIDSLQTEQENVLQIKAALEEQNELALEQIGIIEQEIAHYEELIRRKGLEVDEARNRESLQLSRYRTRIRAMEENGGYNILALILQAQSFPELLTAFDDMGEIMAGDRQLQLHYEAARAETEQILAEFEQERAGYEAEQEILRGEQDGIQTRIDETTQRLADLQEQIDRAIEEFEAAEAAEAAAAATIERLIADRAARMAAERAAAAAAAAAARAEAQAQVEQMRQANADAEAAGDEPPFSEQEIQQTADAGEVGYVSGEEESGYVWPLPCSTRVTSRYGNRTDPFTGETRYHSGLDIDGFGNDGAPVVAAASGEVITAAYDSAYGNYIIIDHGSTSTVYAHMSGLAVSYGETVTRGQTIGYVGSTGRATGTHLHFEVYVGGSRVDPAQYFSGISYYNC